MSFLKEELLEKTTTQPITYKISFSEKPLLRKINYEKQYYDGEIYLPILYSTKVKYRRTIFRVKKKLFQLFLDSP